MKTSKRNFKKRKFKTLLSFEGEQEKKKKTRNLDPNLIQSFPLIKKRELVYHGGQFLAKCKREIGILFSHNIKNVWTFMISAGFENAQSTG